jgi:hypothetical protein
MGIAHALDDGNSAFVIELLQGGHVGVKTNPVVDPQHLVLRYSYRRAVVLVQRVAVRHYRVKSVISPGQLQDYQYRVFFGRSHVLFSYSFIPFVNFRWDLTGKELFLPGIKF